MTPATPCRRVFLTPLSLLMALTCMSRFAPAQPATDSDPLDGAIVQIESAGKTNRYRLAAAPAQAPAQNLPQAPAAAPAGKDDAFSIILSSAIAPATIHVSAAHLPLANGSPLTARYEWDFGDPQGAYNHLVGFNAAHVYRNPGQYTIRLTLTDEAGVRIEQTKQITVLPNNRRTIYVAASGSDSNDGQSPATAVRTTARAAKLIRANTRVLFRHGDTFDMTQPMVIEHENVLIGGYVDLGDSSEIPAELPPRPVLRQAGKRDYLAMIIGSNRANDLVIQELAFDSIFDSDTHQNGMADCIKPAGANTTVRNCEFRNIGTAVNANNNPRGVLMQDNTAPLLTGIRAYFAWVQGSDFVFLGNTVANSTREHIVRIGGPGADRVLFAHNRFDNLDRRPDDPHDTAKGSIVAQRSSFVYVTQNLVRHGTVGVGPLAGDTGLPYKDSRAQFAVIERNTIGSFLNFPHGAEHLMVRNNLFFRNDWTAIVIESYNEQFARGVRDVTIANNTAINNSARGNFIRVLGPVDGITLANNLYVAPKLDPTQPGTAPLYVEHKDLSSFRAIANNIWPTCAAAGAGAGIQYVAPGGSGGRGYHKPAAWSAMPQVQNDQFVDVTLDEQHAPAANSPAANSARPVPGVIEDFHGTKRPATQISIGAIQR